MLFFLIVWHFSRLLSTVAFKIRLALFRAITLNISVHTCYWAAREGIACGHRRNLVVASLHPLPFGWRDQRWPEIRLCLQASEGNAHSRNTFHPCQKRQNGRRNSQKDLPTSSPGKAPWGRGWRPCVSHSSFNGADFCGEGTGHGR